MLAEMETETLTPHHRRLSMRKTGTLPEAIKLLKRLLSLFPTETMKFTIRPLRHKKTDEVLTTITTFPNQTE